MPKTTIFLGSSSAAKSQAKAIMAAFQGPSIEFLPWWDAFTAGETLLSTLDHIRHRVDAALLVFSPESTTTIRGTTNDIPNLNVVFEFGYFYGALGKTKVALLKYGQFYLPTDFGGYIHISGSRYFKRGAVVKVGAATKREFARWIQEV